MSAQNWIVTHARTGLRTVVCASSARHASEMVARWVQRPPGEFHAEPEPEPPPGGYSPPVPGTDPRKDSD